MREELTRAERGAASLDALAEQLTSLPPEWCEIRLATRFIDQHARDWRYCAGFGRWMRWDGVVWRVDGDLAAFDLARAVCATAATEALAIDTKNKALANTIGRAATVAAVERLAKAMREVATTPETWDADPWALCTPGGVVNLRDGSIRPPDRNAFCTKITGVAPGGNCPIWRRFLAEVTAGDPALQLYLQCIAGYALAGDISEHALIFVHGPGGNGKSVFVSTLQHVFGDYAAVAPIEAFTTQAHGDRHPTDLAGLRGARLVTATETEEGRRWAESRIKQLTGGDRITARFMRQDFFTYQPQFTLMVIGNHKPRIQNLDDAMRRRLRLVPFTFTPSVPDRQLPEKLKAEAGGILAWAIEGCLLWQRGGLVPPTVVQTATQDYFSDEDAVGRWLEEHCEKTPEGWEPMARLFADWKDWAGSVEEGIGSQRRLADQLLQRGFERHRTMHGRGFRGLTLLSQRRAGHGAVRKAHDANDASPK